MAMCPENVSSSARYAVGVVRRLPVDVAHGRHLEQPAALDLDGLLGQLAGCGEHVVLRQPLTDLVVDLLDLLEERVAAHRAHVVGAPEREVPVRPEHLVGPPVAHVGVDPVPRRRGVHEVEGVLPRRPGLERARDHVHVRVRREPATRLGRQPLAELDGRDATAEPSQRQGRRAGATPHLEQSRARADPGRGDQRVDELVGVRRPRVGVRARDRVEGGAEAVRDVHQNGGQGIAGQSPRGVGI